MKSLPFCWRIWSSCRLRVMSRVGQAGWKEPGPHVAVGFSQAVACRCWVWTPSEPVCCSCWLVNRFSWLLTVLLALFWLWEQFSEAPSSLSSHWPRLEFSSWGHVLHGMLLLGMTQGFQEIKTNKQNKQTKQTLGECHPCVMFLQPLEPRAGIGILSVLTKRNMERSQMHGTHLGVGAKHNHHFWQF